MSGAGAGFVYLACAATSCLCAVLLFRGYFSSGVRLLFWSAICFVGLTIDNSVLFLDEVIFPEINLELWRRLPGLIALMVLLYGLIWESK